jgi:DNA modification methylase
MTPYYQDDAVTIYHGDCREWMPEVDVIVTDPPYGVSWDGDSRSRGGNLFAPIVGDDEPFDPAHLLALSLPTVLFGGNYYASRLPESPSWIVWDKRRPGVSNSQADVEMAWTNLGGPARIVRLPWMGADRATERGEHYHPTQKPVAVMRQIIAWTPEGTVLDPYMGSGSTLVAAKESGRRAIGVEIEERYCEIAATRCSQEVLGLAL